MGKLENWDISEVDKWWKKGIEKEKFRHTNSPKAHKGDRFSVPTDFSNFAPELDRSRSYASKRRASRSSKN